MDSTKTPELVLETWFGEVSEEGLPLEAHKSKRWFKSTPEFDQQLRWLFENDLKSVSEDMPPLWQSSPEHWLSYIILTDQIPRFIFRSSAQAFTCDSYSLKACLLGLEQEMDLKLKLGQRAFFYLPLQHSESESHQNMCVEKFQALSKEACSEASTKLCEQLLASAKTHQRIIKQFNRFPHRNALLNRENTPAEDWFLETTKTRSKQA